MERETEEENKGGDEEEVKKGGDEEEGEGEEEREGEDERRRWDRMKSTVPLSSSFSWYSSCTVITSIHG